MVGFVGAPWAIMATAACYGLYVVSLILISNEKFEDAPSHSGMSGIGPWQIFHGTPLLMVLMIATVFFNRLFAI